MKLSSELENLIIQLYDKGTSGGLFDFARRLFSRRKGVVVIGSQPGDRYEGYETIMRFYERESAGGVRIKVEEIKAYKEDPFGWAVDRVTAELPDGTQVPVRHTYIFHQERKEWKIIHVHISVGVPDESLGMLNMINQDTIR